MGVPQGSLPFMSHTKAGAQGALSSGCLTGPSTSQDLKGTPNAYTHLHTHSHTHHTMHKHSQTRTHAHIHLGVQASLTWGDQPCLEYPHLRVPVSPYLYLYLQLPSGSHSQCELKAFRILKLRSLLLGGNPHPWSGPGSFHELLLRVNALGEPCSEEAEPLVCQIVRF